VGLSTIRAAAARDGLYALTLFADSVVKHGVSQEDQSVRAGVRVVVLINFAWAQYARLFGVHWGPFPLGRASGELGPSRGGFLRCQHPYCLMGVLKNQYIRARISRVEVNPTRCKELRAARGLSIRKLAEEAGVSTETIYSIEHGKRQPTVTTLGKIASALGVEVKDFFS
jgi:DNA-binding XRE family transcriptional regulator